MRRENERGSVKSGKGRKKAGEQRAREQGKSRYKAGEQRAREQGKSRYRVGEQRAEEQGKGRYRAKWKETDDQRRDREKTGGQKSQEQKVRDEKRDRQRTDGQKAEKQRFEEQRVKKRIKKSIPGQECPVEKYCGGCQYLNCTYEKQLAMKQDMVKNLLAPYCPVHRITGMEAPFHYRNKVHAVFAHRRDGSVISGIYAEGTHDVVPVEQCLLEDEKADEIIGSIRGLLKSFKIKTYDEDTGYGLFRHVLIRTARQTGQIMVVLVLGSPILPSKNNFVKALLALHPEITTIVLNVNDKKTSMVLGERETVLYGRGYIEDVLCGCRFRISAKSFYQVNSIQTEALYGKAIELAGLTGTQRVIDAYCGIGTIGLVAAKRAGEVIGVELNPDAVRDAVRNAKANGAKNVCFYQNDAGRFMMQMAEAGEQVDVVFMDPPRAGSDEAFLSSVIRLAPERVVYISCNPQTQARDLKYLTRHGYHAVGTWPYDMFPFANHVEVVCLMSKVAK